MDAENATRVTAMRPDLLTETRGITQVANGQQLSGDPLIAVEGSNWLFRGGDQVFLIHHIPLLLLLASLAYDLKRRGTAAACYVTPYVHFVRTTLITDLAELFVQLGQSIDY